MRMDLHRYLGRIEPDMVPILLEDPHRVPIEDVGESVDLTDLLSVVATMADGDSTLQRAKWDSIVLEPLHRAMQPVSRRITCDMRVWRWLCIVPMKEFVLRRWCGASSQDGMLLTPAQRGRFLGSRSLHGMSRNALARLFWCADLLWTEDNGYALAREAIANQDFYQAIFERALGNYPPAARAALRVLRDADEGQRRRVLRNLNYHLSTTALEAMEEDELVAVLTGLRARDDERPIELLTLSL
jgi:hypothetical protein